MTKAVS